MDAHYENIKQEAAQLLGPTKENDVNQTYEEISDSRQAPNDTYAVVDKTKKKVNYCSDQQHSTQSHPHE